jgi:hypothetical protein
MYDYATFFILLLLSIVSISLIFLVVIGVMVTAIFVRTNARNSGYNEPEDQAQPGYSELSGPQAAPSSSAAPEAASIAASGDENEIIAVISATIAAMCGESARVVAIAPASSAGPRRGSQGTVWRVSGRLQNLEGFSEL